MNAMLVSAAAIALVASGFALGCWLRRRHARREIDAIRARLEAMLDAADDPAGQRHGHAPGGLADAVEAVAVLHQQHRQQLAQEVTRREQAEARWRESEQRYALAVRGANDGMWELDPRTGCAQFSPRWKAMLGYAEGELDDRLEEWTQRIHPEDRERVVGELDLHLQGHTARFESEHRLRHRDGAWRWVLTRGSAVRHANGKASRLVGLMTDVSARKRVQEALIELAEGLANLRGEACFEALVRSFAQVLGVREAFVCECMDNLPGHVRMLARWKGGALARCVEFDLTGTACEEVIGRGTAVFWPRDAGERWPLEREFEREAYLGLPCFDSGGRVIGHIACADPGSMPEELPHQAILKIFAVRAGIELERRQLARERLAVEMRDANFPVALH